MGPRCLFLLNFVTTPNFGIADAFFSLYVSSLRARGRFRSLDLKPEYIS